MPAEVVQLEDAPIPIPFCPRCGRTFRPFMRGQVQRDSTGLIGAICRLFGKRYPYCALICSACKEIVGYE